MRLDLAQLYGTPGTEQLTEDQEKVAQAELFAKLAADQGIDINDLDDDQVEALWNATFSKEAQEGKPCPECGKTDCTCPAAKKDEGGGGETKESAAQLEFDAIKAGEQEFQEKCAEFDYLGRLMAHAYVQELGEIGENMNKEALDVKGLIAKGKGKAQAALSAAKAKGQAAGAAAKGKAQAARGAAERHLESVGGRMESAYAKRQAKKGVHPSDVKSLTSGQRKALGAAPYAAGAAAAGGGALAMRKKSSANIDELALAQAIEKAAEAGYDPEECDTRLASVVSLGLVDESEKIASANSLDEAVEVRALEYLEAGGYPVTWEGEG